MRQTRNWRRRPHRWLKTDAAGVIFLKVDSVLRDAKGSFTYNLGAMKREPILNADGTVAGYKEMPQVPRIEGVITDQNDLTLSDFINITDATITLELANGKVVDLRNAWYAADGDVTTEEGEIQVLFQGLSAEETNSGTTGLEGGTPPGIEIPDELDPFAVGEALGI